MYNGENKMPKIENWRDDSEGKGICHKAEDLCLIPRTHMVGENRPPKNVSSDLHTRALASIIQNLAN